MEITGTLYSYSFLCYRKVWYFYHNLGREKENENIQLGKLLDENTFIRDKKNIMVDNTINIDFIRNNIVYEIKKSNRELQMAENQVKYYLYILKNKGINTFGVIKIPSKKEVHEVKLSKEDILFIEKRIKDIEKVINDKVPELINIRACSKCSYYEFCHI